MQLESNSTKVAKKAKASMIQESTKLAPLQKNKQPVLQFACDCAKQPKCGTALEVDEIVREFVNTNIYIDAATPCLFQMIQTRRNFVSLQKCKVQWHTSLVLWS